LLNSQLQFGYRACDALVVGIPYSVVTGTAIPGAQGVQ
jgi:hypothetical protein